MPYMFPESDELLKEAKYLAGETNMTTMEDAEAHLPALVVSDGPFGVRKERPKSDAVSSIASTLSSTCFPAGVNLASSWNRDLLEEIGRALGEECIYYDVNILLGPAMNIQRNPLCGRNFEYYSEDPFLTGEIATSYVLGLQSEGVGACLKHYACNSNETWRFTGNSVVDERALTEIYLRGFEKAVKKAHPYSVMMAYNQVNGTYATENTYLIGKKLRGEWGFDGLVMSDWGASHDRVKGIKAGMDLEMPGMVPHTAQVVAKEAHEHPEFKKDMDLSKEHIHQAIRRTRHTEKPTAEIFEEHVSLALKAAEESAVLLENDGTLPLEEGKRVLVIGDFFRKMRYQGSGSSMIDPYRTISPKDAFDAHNVDYDFARGFDAMEEKPDPKLEGEALEKAKGAETILLFMGLGDFVESEGFDRGDMKLAENQLSLIEKLLPLNKKIVVVLFGGAPVELPFRKKVNSMLLMLLPGEVGGEACYRLLFGKTNPSGKLTQTYPLSYEDVPEGSHYVRTPIEVYRESIFVGYRYYLTYHKEVAYPFGYGLSYTTFAYSELKAEVEDSSVKVSFKLTNTGTRKGKEIPEIYVSKKDTSFIRPLRELKGFTKAELEPGECKKIEIEIPIEEFEVYSFSKQKKVLEDGIYTLEVGASSTDIRLSCEITLAGDKVPEVYPDGVKEAYQKYGESEISDEIYAKLLGYEVPQYVPPKKKHYTYETTLREYESWFGKFFRKMTMNVGLKAYKKAKKKPESNQRDKEMKGGYFVYRLMPSNSLRSMANSSAGQLKYDIAQGLLWMVNGHFFKGLFRMMKKE